MYILYLYIATLLIVDEKVCESAEKLNVKYVSLIAWRLKYCYHRHVWKSEVHLVS